MSFRENEGSYIYQGNSLVVPDGTPDDQLQHEVRGDTINAAFVDGVLKGGVLKGGALKGGALKGGADSFSVPALEGQGSTALSGGLKAERIRVITLPEGELPAGWKAVPMRQALNIITGETMAESSGAAGRILRSFHISQWRQDSRFCGRCGGKNRDADSGETARQCTVCGRLEYPRIAPAAIILITNDSGQALLAHNKNFAPGVYSLVAGFNEAGESLEATVAREIKEEVNVEVTDIRYIRSQPWPFPHSLMLGFAARYCGGEIKPDGIEIEDARWFSRDDLPRLPGSSSVSRYLIGLWLEGHIGV